MLKYGLLIFAMLVVQGIMTYFQIKDYRKNVSQIRKKGRLFVGQVKGRIRAGSIVLMAVDPIGTILDARAMTGITVFHRFKTIEEVIGKNITDNNTWIKQIKNKQMVKAILKGIDVMNQQDESKLMETPHKDNS